MQLPAPLLASLPVTGRSWWLGLAAVLLLVGCSSAEAPSYEAQLAEHLSTSGAKMYGAYWCPHCQSQKAMFERAAKKLPYVECDRNGTDPQPQLCQQKNIQGYPTWEIDGQLYPGLQSLETLAQLSQFEGF